MAEVFNEMSASDIDELGLVIQPAKQVSVSQSAARRARLTPLRPFDVVLAIKGSAGKVGLVFDMPADAKWIANQSFVILRVNDMKGRSGAPQLSPLVLFRYLSSELGQAMLKRFIGGAVIPSIAINDLRQLAIPVPDLEEQHQIAGQLTSMLETAVDLRQRRLQLLEQRRALWPDARTHIS